MVKFIEVPQVNLRVMSLNMQFGSGPVDNENDFMRHIPFEEMVYNLQEIADNNRGFWIKLSKIFLMDYLNLPYFLLNLIYFCCNHRFLFYFC